MNDAFLGLLIAAGGMFVLLAGWVAIQSAVRRRSGCRNPDKDVLDFMLDGCGGSCRNKGECHSAGHSDSHLHEQEAHHETL